MSLIICQLFNFVLYDSIDYLAQSSKTSYSHYASLHHWPRVRPEMKNKIITRKTIQKQLKKWFVSQIQSNTNYSQKNIIFFWRLRVKKRKYNYIYFFYVSSNEEWNLIKSHFISQLLLHYFHYYYYYSCNLLSHVKLNGKRELTEIRFLSFE